MGAAAVVDTRTQLHSPQLPGLDGAHDLLTKSGSSDLGHNNKLLCPSPGTSTGYMKGLVTPDNSQDVVQQHSITHKFQQQLGQCGKSNNVCATCPTLTLVPV